MEYENTVSNNTYNTVLDLDAAQKIVFKQYIKKISTDEITSNDLQPENYTVWLAQRIVDLQNTTAIDWEKDIFPYVITELGLLSSIRSITVNKITGDESKISENSLYDLPASAILFSDKYQKKSIIHNDWNYLPIYTGNILISRKLGNDYIKKDNNYSKFDNEYWENNYSFSNKYDYDEYLLYDIVQEYYPEDLTKIVAGDVSFNMARLPVMVGSIIVTFSFNGQYIPVVYCDLHNAIKTFNGKLKITWSPLGLITAENEEELIE